MLHAAHTSPERSENLATCCMQEQEVVVFKKDAEFASAYDCVLGQQSTQEDVYAQVKGARILSVPLCPVRSAHVLGHKLRC